MGNKIGAAAAPQPALAVPATPLRVDGPSGFDQAQFTPGPWRVDGNDRNGQAIVRAEHIEVATCWHHCVGSIEKEMRFNAHLIAAAPELYEALDELHLKAVVGSKDELHAALETAWRALALARGGL